MPREFQDLLKCVQDQNLVLHELTAQLEECKHLRNSIRAKDKTIKNLTSDIITIVDENKLADQRKDELIKRLLTDNQTLIDQVSALEKKIPKRKYKANVEKIYKKVVLEEKQEEITPIPTDWYFTNIDDEDKLDLVPYNNLLYLPTINENEAYLDLPSNKDFKDMIDCLDDF